jgi:hypothetical protein
MRRFPSALFLFFLIFLWVGVATAAPLDLSTFTADPGVTENSGTVSFTEDMTYATWYFYNDNFSVPSNATDLSFDYDFVSGPDDSDDYLTFEINYNIIQSFDVNDPTGHFNFDLSPFQNQNISIAWGLIWGGDEYAGSTASISNLDLATQSAPVPEPGTMLLLGSGVLSLFGFRRRYFFKKF